MKKHVLMGLIASLIAFSSLVGCFGDDTAAKASTTSSSIVITKLTPPTGFSPINGAGSNPVLIADKSNLDPNRIALPGDHAYRIFTNIDSTTMTVIRDAGSSVGSVLLKDGVLIVAGNNAFWIAPTPSKSSAAIKAAAPIVIGNVSQDLSIPASVTTVSTDQTTVTNLFLAMYTGQLNGIISVSNIGSTVFFIGFDHTNIFNKIKKLFQVSNNTTTEVDLSACNLGSDTLTTTQAEMFSGKQFLSVGTEGGIVCVQNGSGGQWDIMSNQAPTARTPAQANYTKGLLLNYAFHGNSDGTYFGFWNVQNPANIYRIAGTNADTTPTATSFWNTTYGGSQSRASGGESVTFSNVPAALSGSNYQMLISKSGSLYTVYPGAESSEGFIFRLDKDITKWVGGSFTPSNIGVVLSTNVYMVPNGGESGVDIVFPDAANNTVSVISAN